MGNLTTEPKWLEWAKELQSLAQNGLTYSKSVFDTERYERIREIAAEIINCYSDVPLEKVKALFCNEEGFQTPKLDTRGVIFRNDKILLVQENDGRWSLPGGWVDFNQSVKSNTEKEVLEEAGLVVKAKQVLAIHDRNKHNVPVYIYNVCKFFILCEVLEGNFKANSETIGTQYFALSELPQNVAEEKNTLAQIKMCFEAYKNPNWALEFD